MIEPPVSPPPPEASAARNLPEFTKASPMGAAWTPVKLWSRMIGTSAVPVAPGAGRTGSAAAT